MKQSIGKITVRAADGRVLGTIEQLDVHQYEYKVRRTRGYAGSYKDALTMVKKLSDVLDKRCKAA